MVDVAAMTAAMAELLRRYRQMIADMQRQVDAFDDGRFTLHSNGEDITAETRADTCRKIDELKALVAKHDPDNWTALH